MRLVKHTIGHFFIHLALFAGFALLVPVMGDAWDKQAAPWTVSPNQFWGGAMLVLICIFLMYRLKESISDVLQSLGQMMFIPGALNVLFSFFNADKVFTALRGITGGAIIEPAAKFYVGHSVPTIMSIAAIYMCIGGIVYWIGRKMDDVQDKFSWN